MTKPSVIFPDVEVKQDGESIRINTTVRTPLEDGSGHYFWTVSEAALGSSSKDLQGLLCRFNSMVYMSIVNGKFNEAITNQFGTPLHKLDDNNETECERMRRIFLKKIGA